MDFQKGIHIPGPLSILGPYPADIRTLVDTINDRDEIPEEIIYPGMRIYVKDINQEFIYTNGIWLSSNPDIYLTMLDNLMDIVLEISHAINKPFSTSNVIMIDLNNDDEITGSILKDDGMAFF